MIRLTKRLSVDDSAQVVFRECPECKMVIERAADHLPGCARPPTRERRVGTEGQSNLEYLERMVEDLARRGVVAVVKTRGRLGWVERRA